MVGFGCSQILNLVLNVFMKVNVKRIFSTSFTEKKFVVPDYVSRLLLFGI